MFSDEEEIDEDIIDDDGDSDSKRCSIPKCDVQLNNALVCQVKKEK
jgi:hypothetical protein